MTTVIDNRPKHSPLGASGAERWLNCAGSVALIQMLDLSDEDDPTYRVEGSAMHEGAARCLTQQEDAWQIEDKWTLEGTDTVVEVTDEMRRAVQIYLGRCREDMDTAAEYFIETPVSAPEHPQFYGTVDFGAVWRSKAGAVHRVKIRDFKGGAGVVVDVEENPQLMYYCWGLIHGWNLPDETPVELEIVQPRAYDPDGIIRTWETTVGFVREWVHTVLVPGMDRTSFDHDLAAGEWCRFCPAKLICPKLTSLFRAAAVANPKEIPNLSDEMLGESWKLIAPAKKYIDALKAETQKRLEAGKKMSAVMLTYQKANRVYKPGAPLEETFGDAIWSPRERLGPAGIDELPGGVEFNKKWAFTPQNGYTVCERGAKKVEVIIKSSTDTFKDAIANLPSE